MLFAKYKAHLEELEELIRIQTAVNRNPGSSEDMIRHLGESIVRLADSMRKILIDLDGNLTDRLSQHPHSQQQPKDR